MSVVLLLCLRRDDVDSFHLLWFHNVSLEACYEQCRLNYETESNEHAR